LREDEFVFFVFESTEMFFFVFESTKTRIFEENFKRKHPVIDRSTSVGSKLPPAKPQLAVQAHANKLRNTKWFVKKNKAKQKFGRSIYILYISKEFELFIAKRG